MTFDSRGDVCIVVFDNWKGELHIHGMIEFWFCFHREYLCCCEKVLKKHGTHMAN